jgi:D-3-phosphoglycerate dehydrogenase
LKLLLIDPLDAEGVLRLRAAGVEVASIAPGPGPWWSRAAGYPAIVVRSTTQVDRQALANLPRLRLIGCAGVGTDNVDLEEAARRRIAVVNTPEANVVSAAEHTLALLLAVARRIVDADLSMKAGRWDREELRGVELAGRTLGIVGLGRVGSRVAVRARAFEMNLVACDPYVEAERFASVAARRVGFTELLEVADVVTFHVPLTAETRHMLDGAALERLRPGGLVINAARGAVVDEAALLQALDRGQVAGAGIDVFEVEPSYGCPLARHPRVVATPHLGARTVEAQRRVATELADRLIEEFERSAGWHESV